MRPWCLLPDDVRQILKKNEWDNPTRLRARLSGVRPFPIQISLKVPTGAQVLSDMEHFQQYLKLWLEWPNQEQIQWSVKQFREVGEHTVAHSIRIENIKDLIEILGPSAIARSKKWEALMLPILKLNENLYPVLLGHIKLLETMLPQDTQLLAQLLPQLQPGMGNNLFLRALPLHGVDTKFVEDHFNLINDLLDSLYHGEVNKAGGLLSWLACLESPKNWLFVKPLCLTAQKQLGNLALLQLPKEVLINQSLPASNIIIVENAQSGFSLPELADTIAVFGGGRNISWMEAPWLKTKQLAYWGDIDTWGLSILSDARTHLPTLDAIMMDHETVVAHQDRMSKENKSCETLPINLTADEKILFTDLQNAVYKNNRLEQERISADYILNQFSDFVKG